MKMMQKRNSQEQVLERSDSCTQQLNSASWTSPARRSPQTRFPSLGKILRLMGTYQKKSSTCRNCQITKLDEQLVIRRAVNFFFRKNVEMVMFSCAALLGCPCFGHPNVSSFWMILIVFLTSTMRWCPLVPSASVCW